MSRRNLSEMTPGAELLEQGRRAAPERIHQTAYMRRFDAASEGEVKQRARDEGRVMYHIHIGLSDWPATARARRDLAAWPSAATRSIASGCASRAR